jgi:uncharacterized protein YcbX
MAAQDRSDRETGKQRSSPMPTIERINRYPIKGLSAEPLQAVALATGEVLPLDRKFALARPGAPFDTERPAWLPKRNFLMLMVDERLAELQVGYHDETGRLTIDRAGQRLLEADVRDAEGRDAVERFFEAFMGEGLGGRPRLVSAAGHSFTDHAEKRISLINLDTVREIERRIGCPVDPLRFRGNLYVSGVPAWAELEWVGSTLVAGEVRFRVAKPIDRCAATNVDPATGLRDLNIPQALRQHYGHIDCGVLLRIVRGGRIHIGQAIEWRNGDEPAEAGQAD